MRRNLIGRWLPRTGNRVKEIYEMRGDARRGRDVNAWMDGWVGAVKPFFVRALGC